MKIRTDFVTNSSSSSYIMCHMNNPQLFRELERVGISCGKGLELPEGPEYKDKDGGSMFFCPDENSYSAKYLSYIMEGCDDNKYVYELLKRLKKAGLIQYKKSVDKLMHYVELLEKADSTLKSDERDKYEDEIYEVALKECAEIHERAIGEIFCYLPIFYEIKTESPEAIEYTAKMHECDSKIIEAEFRYYSEFEGECCGNYHKQIKNDNITPLVKKSKGNLKKASEVKKADKNYNIKILKERGEELRFANEQMKSDKDVVLIAVNSCGTALEWASSELKSDREVVLAAVRNAGGALMDADELFRADREIVLEAVKTNGAMLELASDDLKSDREIVLTAVKTAGLYLNYADKKFLGDREIVLEAVKSYGHIYKFISDELKNDKEIIMEALKSECIWNDIPQKTRNDNDIVSAVINNYSYEFKSMDRRIRNSKKFVLLAVKQAGYTFQYATDILKRDKKFILKVAEISVDALKYISDELKKDEDIIKLAKENNIDLYERYWDCWFE